jgi:hypothetical protein
MHPPAPVSPPYFETGHPFGHDQFISAMAESRAVMALADALGPAKPGSVIVKEIGLASPWGLQFWSRDITFLHPRNGSCAIHSSNAAVNLLSAGMMQVLPGVERPAWKFCVAAD